MKDRSPSAKAARRAELKQHIREHRVVFTAYLVLRLIVVA